MKLFQVREERATQKEQSHLVVIMTGATTKEKDITFIPPPPPRSIPLLGNLSTFHYMRTTIAGLNAILANEIAVCYL